jgi:two-component system chemotaxis response regulator CheB
VRKRWLRTFGARLAIIGILDSNAGISDLFRGSQMNTRKKIRVLVVDDSALMRQLLTELIGAQKDMEVVCVASDPYIARQMIRSHNPDVITLDVEMPRMDGLKFLENLMRLRPMPVVMVSTLTEKGSDISLRALELGAVDFVAKPKLDIVRTISDYGEEIAEKIRAAAQARILNRAREPLPPLPKIWGPAISTEHLIAVGASTGGTEAIRTLLEALPPDGPGILIAQHMPEGFTRSFAARLDSLSRMSVKEAEDGERVLPGHAYIAPGGRSHLLLQRSGANYLLRLSQTEPVNRHRPSVDVLFQSVAAHAGPNAIGVILTGMGKDGAQGLLDMHLAGAHTLAQDEASCVVFGMPKEAIAIGAVDEVASIENIPAHLLKQVAARGPRSVRI